MVQTVKNFLKKSDDPHLALLEYRTTPLETLGYSPSQLLMGRRLNSKLPIAKSLLQPKPVNKQTVSKNIKETQQRYKLYYDKGTKPLNPLTRGSGVRFWNHQAKTWKPAVIVREMGTPRSYMIQTEKGVIRRNRQDLKTSRDVDPEKITQPTTLEPPDPGPTSREAPPVEPQQPIPETIPSPKQQSPVKTRCGREVRLPARFKE
jgi:hypothetical protein